MNKIIPMLLVFIATLGASDVDQPFARDLQSSQERDEADAVRFNTRTFRIYDKAKEFLFLEGKPITVAWDERKTGDNLFTSTLLRCASNGHDHNCFEIFLLNPLENGVIKGNPRIKISIADFAAIYSETHPEDNLGLADSDLIEFRISIEKFLRISSFDREKETHNLVIVFDPSLGSRIKFLPVEGGINQLHIGSKEDALHILGSEEDPSNIVYGVIPRSTQHCLVGPKIVIDLDSGEIIPTGLCRSFPNLVSFEGIASQIIESYNTPDAMQSY